MLSHRLEVTSEILLEELRQAFNDLGNQDDFDISNPEGLRSWLTRNYTAEDAPFPGKLYFVELLAKLLTIPSLKIRKGRHLREFISTHGIKRHPRENNPSLDPSAEIPIALSHEKAYEEALTEGIRGLDREKSDRSHIKILDNMLQAANILNMLIAMNGLAMHEELELLGISKLQKFNKIAVILVHPRPDHSGSINDLGQFAQEFLKGPLISLQNLTNIAKAFAKLSFFVTLKDSSYTYFNDLASAERYHEQKEETAEKVEMEELPVLTDFTFLREACYCNRTELSDTQYSLFLHFKDPFFLPTRSGLPEEIDFQRQVSQAMPNGYIRRIACFHAILGENDGGARNYSKEKALDWISLLYNKELATHSPHWLRKELGYVDSPTIYRFLRWVEKKVCPNG
jgi:hypothetical protein